MRMEGGVILRLRAAQRGEGVTDHTDFFFPHWQKTKWRKDAETKATKCICYPDTQKSQLF